MSEAEPKDEPGTSSICGDPQCQGGELRIDSKFGYDRTGRLNRMVKNKLFVTTVCMLCVIEAARLAAT